MIKIYNDGAQLAWPQFKWTSYQGSILTLKHYTKLFSPALIIQINPNTKVKGTKRIQTVGWFQDHVEINLTMNDPLCMYHLYGKSLELWIHTVALVRCHRKKNQMFVTLVATRHLRGCHEVTVAFYRIPLVLLITSKGMSEMDKLIWAKTTLIPSAHSPGSINTIHRPGHRIERVSYLWLFQIRKFPSQVITTKLQSCLMDKQFYWPCL